MRCHHACVAWQFTGSGFLYKMVRHMVGALLAIGQGKLDPELIYTQLEIGGSCKPGTVQVLK